MAGTTDQRPVYAFWFREDHKAGHLAPVDGGPFICGTPSAPYRWAQMGIVDGVTVKGCPGCHALAPSSQPV